MTATEKKLVVLFDEFGTPTFKNTHTSDLFLGVSVLYELLDEDKIFNALDEDMGLSNSKPLKNDRINQNRANEIANEIAKHNVLVNAKYLDLTNPLLRSCTPIYAEFGNISRKLWRNVGERKDAHILHSQILQSCLFDIISRFPYSNIWGRYYVDIWIDNWSYPETDIQIVKNSAESLQKRIQELINDSIKAESEIIIELIKFFDSTSQQRERFIDVLTSIISRSFLDKNNPKFDTKPVEELSRGLGDRFILDDITSYTINLFNDIIYKGIQETKTKEKSLIIL